MRRILTWFHFKKINYMAVINKSLLFFRLPYMPHFQKEVQIQKFTKRLLHVLQSFWILFTITWQIKTNQIPERSILIIYNHTQCKSTHHLKVTNDNTITIRNSTDSEIAKICHRLKPSSVLPSDTFWLTLFSPVKRKLIVRTNVIFKFRCWHAFSTTLFF